MATIEKVSPYVTGKTDVDKHSLIYPCLKAGMFEDAIIFGDNLEMIPGVTNIRKVMIDDGFYDVKIEIMTPQGYWAINIWVCDPRDLTDVAMKLSIGMATATRLSFVLWSYPRLVG